MSSTKQTPAESMPPAKPVATVSATVVKPAATKRVKTAAVSAAVVKPAATKRVKTVKTTPATPTHNPCQHDKEDIN